MAGTQPRSWYRDLFEDCGEFAEQVRPLTLASSPRAPTTQVNKIDTAPLPSVTFFARFPHARTRTHNTHSLTT
jgi:hypothetical protein